MENPKEDPKQEQIEETYYDRNSIGYSIKNDGQDINICKNFDRETGCELIDCPCENEMILSDAKEKAFRDYGKQEIQPEQIWNDDKMEVIKEAISKHKQEETIEETIGLNAHEYSMKYKGTDKYTVSMLAIEFGYHLALGQQERSYSEEEVLNILDEFNRNYDGKEFLDIWIKQFKKK